MTRRLTLLFSENQAAPTLIRGIIATVLFATVVMILMIRPVRKIIERVSVDATLLTDCF
jgi:hypothetical protein